MMDPNITQLAKMVQDLQHQIQNMPRPQARPSTGINPKTGKPWLCYCYTHSCCNHWGRNCQNKAPDHKDEATFWNHKGGSDKNCLPVKN